MWLRVSTGCHAACAVGCVRTNDITACTTRYYGGRYRDCGRCTDGYRSLNNPQDLGCTPGQKTDTSCVSPSPAPTPCVDPTNQCVPGRRLLDNCNARRVSTTGEALSVLQHGRAAAVQEDVNARQLTLPGETGTCSCDGAHIYTPDCECYFKQSCPNHCTPGSATTLTACGTPV